MTKKPYTKPQLTIHGNVEVLTKGTQIGDLTDADFPARTPRGDLTFS
jgi:hypothetical protein